MIKDIILFVILLGIVVGIGVYLIRAKKRGQTCIGCPYAKQCPGKCAGIKNKSRQYDCLK